MFSHVVVLLQLQRHCCYDLEIGWGSGHVIVFAPIWCIFSLPFLSPSSFPMFRILVECTLFHQDLARNIILNIIFHSLDS
jgi:hypothetical protein